MDKKELKQLIWEILQEETVTVRQAEIPAVTEADRLDTGNPTHRVYTHDLFTVEQSPRLGCGIMEMEDTTFPWHLDYDEIDYIIEGALTILDKGKTTTAQKGQVVFIPKGSDIQFSVTGKSRFLYVTYPADWQN